MTDPDRAGVVVDQSGQHLVVRGEDRVRFVNGMCMGNVAAITPGGFLRTAMLNPKGRILSIFDVAPREDHLVLLLEPPLLATTLAILDRHAIADDVSFELAEAAVHRVWRSPADVWDAPPVFAPPPTPAASIDEVEIRRVEAGLPRFGVDVSEDNFPFETPLLRLIDYRKGCYIGQEPVARVAARGSASKLLLGLRPQPGADPGSTGPFTVGDPVQIPDKPSTGRVTSVARSPRFGEIALAYVPRGAWEPGTVVTVAGRPAVVAELPFG